MARKRRVTVTPNAVWQQLCRPLTVVRRRVHNCSPAACLTQVHEVTENPCGLRASWSARSTYGPGQSAYEEPTRKAKWDKLLSPLSVRGSTYHEVVGAGDAGDAAEQALRLTLNAGGEIDLPL
jgi:hypothetical protein